MADSLGGSSNLWWNPDALGEGFLHGKLNKDEGPKGPSASDMFAQATRQQWSQYVNTFVPIENSLIKYATDPSTVKNAMSDAQTGVQNAFAAQQGATQRKLQGLGVQLSPDEQAAQTRSSGLTESLADVQSQNTARDLTVQRQQSILGSPAPQGV
jgi:hypothetical protein